MSDAPTIGHNGTNEQLLDIVRGIASDLDEADEAKARADEAYVAAKADGWDVKILRKIVKEHRKGAEYQAECLDAEAVLDAYRRAAGLPTTLEVAHAAAREATTVVPEPKRRERPRRKDTEE